jgi:hypothetical protein
MYIRNTDFLGSFWETRGYIPRQLTALHPQYRCCMSSFWGNYDPLMMAMTCWNMVGVNPGCINKSCYFLDAFVGYFITILQTCSVQLSRGHCESLKVSLHSVHAIEVPLFNCSWFVHSNGEVEIVFRVWLQKQNLAYTAIVFADSYQDFTHASVCLSFTPINECHVTRCLLSCP